jgi:hypothetical protein
MNKTLEAWTDYPLPGDKYTSRKLRKITLCSTDGDKYIETTDGEFFKRGYAYRNRRRVPYSLRTVERVLPYTDYENGPAAVRNRENPETSAFAVKALCNALMGTP